MRFVNQCAFIALSFLLTGSAARGDDYYVILFAHQGPSRAATESHTFAAFIRSSNGKERRELGVHCISWLPSSGDIRLLRAPEQGMNLGLKESLDFANARNARVVAWGPYRIEKKLFDRALAQVERLKSGNVAFKAIDRKFRGGNVVNCIHAVSDVADAPLLDTGTAFGPQATAMVRNHLAPAFLDKSARHPWLISSLGLDRAAVNFVDE